MLTRSFRNSKWSAPVRLLETMEAANGNNPYQKPVMSSPPTLTVNAATDAALGPFDFMVASNAIAPKALNQIAFYGGVPTPLSNAFVAMPVTSVLPQTTGNCGVPTSDTNSWASAFEIMTDAITIEFGIFNDNHKKVMFQIDGQYLDFVGSVGLGASAATTFYHLVFATRRARRIRVLIPTHPAYGAAFLKTIRCDTLSTYWKPNMKQVLRVGWSGDSMSEGTNQSATIYPMPNAAWPVLTCELLGLRDCRQLAVGACGYLSNDGGLRSKLRDQMPRWAPHAPFDLLVFSNGYNDASNTPAAITAEVLFDLQLARAMFPQTPIVVLGCQAGNSGPGVTQIATENAISTAVTSFGDPLCKFAPVSTDNPPWVSGTGFAGATNASGNSDLYVDTDNTHQTLAGAEFVSFRAAAAIRTAVASMCF